MSNFLSQEHSPREKAAFYGLFAIIFSFSFYLYSPYTTIRFSSDHAVHVLMAYDFKFPDNLYFWGQNRLGSFVPMVAHLLCSVGVPALLAVTLVHWGILLATALLICRFFSNLFSKVLFLVFWLIPLYPFKEHLSLAHPYAPQFFFLFSGIFLLEKFQSSKKHIWFVFGILILFLSCWISELSAAFIALFLLFKLASRVKYENYQLTLSVKKDGIVLFLITLAAVILTGWFISYAKSNAADVAEYSSILSEPKQWITGMQKHLGDLLRIITDPVQYPFKWLYAVLFLPAIILTISLSWKHRKVIPSEKRFYLRLFSLSALLMWLGLYMLSWTFLNEFDYRHWTFAYLFVIIAVLFAVDNIPSAPRFYKIILTVLAIVQIPISYSYATDKSIMRNDIDFSYSEFKNFQKLGSCGVIGNYWYTYLIAAADPTSIVATPRELEYARNPNLIPLVFQKPKIYLAKNRWLSEWPIFAGQYGHLLQKNGSPFKIEWVEFCEYKLIDNVFSLGSEELKHDSSSISIANRIHINPHHQSMNAFTVFGPFMELPGGHYKGNFILDSVACSKEDTLVIDIVNNWGQLCLFGKTLKGEEIGSPGSLKIPFEFDLHQSTPNIETRIFVKGKPSFILDKVDFVRN
jgi:hypothetical protein